VPSCDFNNASVTDSSDNICAFAALPDSAVLRLTQFIGTIAPVSRSTWLRLVKTGYAPAPVQLSHRVVAWRVGDLRTWLANGGIK
jgi:predicted DNA-binding transcriptional regulator AlpA